MNIITKDHYLEVRKNAPGKKTPWKKAPEKIAPAENDPPEVCPQENHPPDNCPLKYCCTRFLLLSTLSYRCSF